MFAGALFKNFKSAAAIVAALTFISQFMWPARAQAQARLDVVPVAIIGHPDNIIAAASADGKLLLTGGGDNVARLWLRSSGRLLRTLDCHKPPAGEYSGKGASGQVTAVAITGNGLTAVTGGKDGAICVWETTTGRLLRSFPAHQHDVQTLMLTPDAKVIISTGSDDAPEEGKKALDPSTVRLWETATGKRLGGFPGEYPRLAQNVDGSAILVITTDDAKLYEVPGGRVLQSIPEAKNAVAASFQNDGRTLWVAQSNVAGTPSLRAIDIASGKVVRTVALPDFTDAFEIKALSGEAQMIVLNNTERYAFTSAATTSGPQPEGQLEVWSLGASGIEKAKLAKSFAVDEVKFLPGNKQLLTTSADKIEFWDAKSGQFDGALAGAATITTTRLSPDGTHILSSSKDENASPLYWQTFAGALERVLTLPSKMALGEGYFTPTRGDVISSEGSEGAQDGHGRLVIYDSQNHRWLPQFADTPTTAVSSLQAGPWIATTTEQGTQILLWNVETMKPGIKITLPATSGTVRDVKITRDGTLAAILTERETAGDLLIWDMAKSQLLRRYEKIGNERIWTADFSPDGKWIAFGTSKRGGSAVQVRDVRTNASVKEFRNDEGVTSVQFSPSGAYFWVSASWTNRWGRHVYSTKDWSLQDYRFHSGWEDEASTFLDGDQRVLVQTKWGTRAHSYALRTGPDPKSKSLLAITTTGPAPHAYDGPRKRLAIANGKSIGLYALADGRPQGTLEGHLGNVSALDFSADGKYLVSGGEDGTVRLWDLRTSSLLATFIGRKDGEWIVITPEGFFAGSPRAGELLSIVRGLEAFSVDQLRQSLYNPDLVREKIDGDPSGEVARAAKVITLDKILDSGAPPAVTLKSQEARATTPDGLLDVAAVITDAGGGIGRVEWRVNGVTSGVIAQSAKGEKTLTLSHKLALDPGADVVEVVAYNGLNLVASEAASFKVAWDSPKDRDNGRLFVLAIGINGYSDPGYTDPKTKWTKRFKPLGLAVGDAQMFGAAIEAAGKGYYTSVKVTYALEAQAVPKHLDELVDGIAAEITARDTFVFYAAGHGITEQGRFYMIPHDFKSGPAGTLSSTAISQDKLQDWIGNRIKARRAVILLDTCESGALVGGATTSRIEAPASDAAIGRLHEATGRPVLTAAAQGKLAWEGYEGADGNYHGVFTWALAEALKSADTNGNGLIELSELVAFVQDQVPKKSAELQPDVPASKTTAAFDSKPAIKTQTPRFGSKGDDFVLARRVP